ncbi:MAG: S9 family peptidase [Bacteroidales bacterium]
MKTITLFAGLILTALLACAQPSDRLTPPDVFNLEYVSEPQISPDGEKVIYVRNFTDIMTDRGCSNLWIVNFDGSENRPLTTGCQRDLRPRWSHDGKKIVYTSDREGKPELFLYWVDTGLETQLTHVQQSPGAVSWSPDDRWLAFNMFVQVKPKTVIQLPPKPEGAQWNDPPIYIDDLHYRSDGQGYLKEGAQQIFVLPLEGGTPHQLTFQKKDCGTPEWSVDGTNLYFSANLHEDSDFEPFNREIYRVQVASGQLDTLTDRYGPDYAPKPSPDGKQIAYLGYDDKHMTHHPAGLYLMEPDGSNPRLISVDLDREIRDIRWNRAGDGLYFLYDDQGMTRLAIMNLHGKWNDLALDVGGLSLGRPYSGGQYAVAGTGSYAFTLTGTDHPSDLAVGSGTEVKRLTDLNRDLFSYITLGEVEEMWYESSYDNRRIQSWIMKPPHFDPDKKYPMILEIHGGPVANYGPRFSTEMQLYAASGYVVLYVNPRGSDSYGSEFGNLIHHNYPGEDYDDLMSGVDALIKRGYIDEDNLFVTGGSGGGVLSAWIIGKTDRFNAAVVAKPVINWYSMALYTDISVFTANYWFGGYPWDMPEEYLRRSPISLAGNITTPTMVMTGEEDYRTPIAESEQLYGALKMRGVDAAMVRIPNSPHGIASRPSNLIAKVSAVLTWFDRYRIRHTMKQI